MTIWLLQFNVRAPIASHSLWHIACMHSMLQLFNIMFVFVAIKVKMKMIKLHWCIYFCMYCSSELKSSSLGFWWLIPVGLTLCVLFLIFLCILVSMVTNSNSPYSPLALRHFSQPPIWRHVTDQRIFSLKHIIRLFLELFSRINLSKAVIKF